MRNPRRLEGISLVLARTEVTSRSDRDYRSVGYLRSSALKLELQVLSENIVPKTSGVKRGNKRGNKISNALM